MECQKTGFFSGLYRKITGIERLERERYYTDNFTKLPNGFQLQEDYEALPTKDGYDFVLINVNGIPQIATLFDFRAAEKIFLKLCPFLTEFVEKYDGKAYRLALDLFGLLLPVKDQEAFERDLIKLLKEMEMVNVQDEYVEYSCHYTFTYGCYPMTRAEDEVKMIDPILTLTRSVTEGLKNGYQTTGSFFEEKTKPKWELRGKLVNRAQKAWENREFVPYYQMVYDLKSQRPVGAETLTRWEQPELGLIMPNDFIPVMETKGLIMDLDLYMLEEACKKIKGWIDNELVTVPLSINISKLNIHRKNFVDRVIEIVDSYQVPPILIELELSENFLVAERNTEFLDIAQRLHDYGFSLSMDNFAASDQSSLSLLRDLELDVIKISRAFFKNVSLQKESRERVFVKGAVEVAKKLGIKLVAMGVETKEEARLATYLGCDYAQGYFFSKPVSNEEFERQVF